MILTTRHIVSFPHHGNEIVVNSEKPRGSEMPLRRHCCRAPSKSQPRGLRLGVETHNLGWISDRSTSNSEVSVVIIIARGRGPKGP